MRDVLILIALALFAAVVGFFLYFYGQGTLPTGSGAQSAAVAPAPTGTPVATTVLLSGTRSSIGTRTNYLITTSAELAQLWQLTGAPGTAPAIDFSKDAVIAVFAGTEPTAGYGIAVTGVTDSATERMVSITLTSPDATCALAQSQTAPFQVVEVPATALTLAHEDIASTTNCLN